MEILGRKYCCYTHSGVGTGEMLDNLLIKAFKGFVFS